MNEYAELMRDLAHDEPNCGYSKSNLKLTSAQAAVVLRRHTDLLGEALVGAEVVIADRMAAMDARPEHQGLLLDAIAAEVINRVREKAPSWILSDVQDACDEAENERRMEREYA